MDTTETTNGATNETRGEALAVTVREASRMLAVSSRTVYRLAKAGKVRIVRVTPDTPRVIRASLKAFLARADDTTTETGGE